MYSVTRISLIHLVMSRGWINPINPPVFYLFIQEKMFLLASVLIAAVAVPAPVNVRLEHMPGPVVYGVDVRNPVLRWSLNIEGSMSFFSSFYPATAQNN